MLNILSVAKSASKANANSYKSQINHSLVGAYTSFTKISFYIQNQFLLKKSTTKNQSTESCDCQCLSMFVLKNHKRNFFASERILGVYVHINYNTLYLYIDKMYRFL